MSQDRVIQTAEDADSITEHIQSVHDGWYSEGVIDWEDFLYRLEEYGLDLGPSMNSPAIRRIKAIVRKLRRS